MQHRSEENTWKRKTYETLAEESKDILEREIVVIERPTGADYDSLESILGEVNEESLVPQTKDLNHRARLRPACEL